MPWVLMTLMGPSPAPVGALALNCVSEWTENELALVPLKRTRVVPVKQEPVIVTLDSAPAWAGEKPDTVGTQELRTWKRARLLPACPEAETVTGPEIAPGGTWATSVVSLNTVRTHTKNIYAKLGVNSRRAAVLRAEELGQLGRGPRRSS